MHLTFSVNAAIKKGKGLDLGVEPQTLLSLDTPPPPPPLEKDLTPLSLNIVWTDVKMVEAISMVTLGLRESPIVQRFFRLTVNSVWTYESMTIISVWMGSVLGYPGSLPTYIERPPWPPPAKKVVKGRSSKGSKPVRVFPLKGSHGRSAV